MSLRLSPKDDREIKLSLVEKILLREKRGLRKLLRMGGANNEVLRKRLKEVNTMMGILRDDIEGGVAQRKLRDLYSSLRVPTKREWGDLARHYIKTIERCKVPNPTMQQLEQTSHIDASTWKRMFTGKRIRFGNSHSAPEGLVFTTFLLLEVEKKKKMQKSPHSLWSLAYDHLNERLNKRNRKFRGPSMRKKQTPVTFNENIYEHSVAGAEPRKRKNTGKH